MKDTDKITLTYKQLKKLVYESKIEEDFSNFFSKSYVHDVAKIVKALGSAMKESGYCISSLEKKDVPKDLINDLNEVLNQLEAGLDKLVSKYIKK